jgi:hypothetical protein
LGYEASFAHMAHAAFLSAVECGHGGEDDGAMLKFYCERGAKSQR